MGTGCIVLNEDSDLKFDVSKPFNQTIYVENGSPWFYLIGKQLPDSIPVLRAASWQSGGISILIGPPDTGEAPAFDYNNITGIVNMTVSSGSYLVDIGPNMNSTLFRPAECYPNPTITYPCLGIKADTETEEPSNCKTNIDINQSSDSLCPRQLTLPEPLATKASYDGNTITKIVSYETTLASDGLPTTINTTEYFIPSFTLPSPYTCLLYTSRCV